MRFIKEKWTIQKSIVVIRARVTLFNIFGTKIYSLQFRFLYFSGLLCKFWINKHETIKIINT